MRPRSGGSFGEVLTSACFKGTSLGPRSGAAAWDYSSQGLGKQLPAPTRRRPRAQLACGAAWRDRAQRRAQPARTRGDALVLLLPPTPPAHRVDGEKRLVVAEQWRDSAAAGGASYGHPKLLAALSISDNHPASRSWRRQARALHIRRAQDRACRTRVARRRPGAATASKRCQQELLNLKLTRSAHSSLTPARRCPKRRSMCSRWCRAWTSPASPAAPHLGAGKRGRRRRPVQTSRRWRTWPRRQRPHPRCSCPRWRSPSRQRRPLPALARWRCCRQSSRRCAASTYSREHQWSRHLCNSSNQVS